MPSIPSLLHTFRLLITRHIRAGTHPPLISTRYALLKHVLASPHPACVYTLLLTALFFRREARRDILRGDVWAYRAETAEWLAAMAARCPPPGGVGWRGVVEGLLRDFSPRGKSSRRPRRSAPSVNNTTAVASVASRRRERLGQSPASAMMAANAGARFRASSNAGYSTQQSDVERGGVEEVSETDPFLGTTPTSSTVHTLRRPPSVVSDAATAATSMHPHRGHLSGDAMSVGGYTDDVSNYESQLTSEAEDDDVQDEGEDAQDKMNAMEIAVLAQAKEFCADPVVSTVVDACWDGRVSFYAAMIDGIALDSASVGAGRDIVRIHGGGPALDPSNAYHSGGWTELWRVSRLRTPRILHILHIVFHLLFIWLYTRILLYRPVKPGLTWPEVALFTWTIALISDSIGRVHRSGWRFYIQHLISPLDLSSYTLLTSFAILRIRGWWWSEEEQDGMTQAGYDLLAIAALPLYARVGTMFGRWEWAGKPLVVVRRALRTFSWPILAFWPIAIIGVMVSLRGLELGAEHAHVSFRPRLPPPSDNPWHGIPDQPWVRLAYYMMKTFLGAVDTAFLRAPEFHPVLGPVIVTLCVAFLVILPWALCLATLFRVYYETTAKNDVDARKRYRYAFTLQILEHVRSEPLYPLVPPLNLLYPVLLLLERFLHPQIYTRICRILLRIVLWPVLLISFFVERIEARQRRIKVLGPSSWGRQSGGGGGIGAVVFGFGLAKTDDVLTMISHEMENAEEKTKLEKEVRELKEALSRLEHVLASAVPPGTTIAPEAAVPPASLPTSSPLRMPGSM